jgi:hypothetical protein
MIRPQHDRGQPKLTYHGLAAHKDMGDPDNQSSSRKNDTGLKYQELLACHPPWQVQDGKKDLPPV